MGTEIKLKNDNIACCSLLTSVNWFFCNERHFWPVYLVIWAFWVSILRVKYILEHFLIAICRNGKGDCDEDRCNQFRFDTIFEVRVVILSKLILQAWLDSYFDKTVWFCSAKPCLMLEKLATVRFTSYEKCFGMTVNFYWKFKKYHAIFLYEWSFKMQTKIEVQLLRNMIRSF